MEHHRTTWTSPISVGVKSRSIKRWVWSCPTSLEWHRIVRSKLRAKSIIMFRSRKSYLRPSTLRKSQLIRAKSKSVNTASVALRTSITTFKSTFRQIGGAPQARNKMNRITSNTSPMKLKIVTVWPCLRWRQGTSKSKLINSILSRLWKMLRVSTVSRNSISN